MRPLQLRPTYGQNLVVFFGVLCSLLLLAGCNSEGEALVLPTRVSVSAEVTADVDAPTEVVRGNAPTLPPTWTPTPIITATPLPPTPTPEIVQSGRVFYIYNGDSIISMNGDGTNNQFILTFGVGALIEDMVMSPDHSLLAFVAPGNGSAREVFVSNLDGTFVLQVSCLGFAEVREPTWSPDSASLAFFGAPALGAVTDVYAVNVNGSGNCPADNNQRMLFSTGTAQPGDVAWSPDGSRIFYSAQGIRIFDLNTGENSVEVTQTPGFGPDFNLTFNPANPVQLAYIRREGSFDGRAAGGSVFILDTSTIASSTLPIAVAGQALQISWDADGQYLVLSDQGAVVLSEIETGSARRVVSFLETMPSAVFDSEREFVIYVGRDPQNENVDQVFSISRLGADNAQLTTHTEGTVSDLIWIAD
ncbi:MAG: hypothetical protein RLP44_01305 [Aggregatilineales bacterium]